MELGVAALNSISFIKIGHDKVTTTDTKENTQKEPAGFL